MAERIAFDTEPAAYRHWTLEIAPPIATLTLAVLPDAGLRADYELKLNSYDLAVDIELHDAVERLRFEHPEVGAVVVTGGLDKVFCAGANIQMLAGATHAHKVNFCKFTNETRNAIEEASTRSGQVWIAAVNGTAAGGGYELALACDEILLVDDRSSAVSLPEVPLLAVLPGTGGLTRVVDKRHVRRDLADLFATRTEGVKGRQAVDWGLVDAIAPRSTWDDVVRDRALARAATSDRPLSAVGADADAAGGSDAGAEAAADPDVARTAVVGTAAAAPAPSAAPVAGVGTDHSAGDARCVRGAGVHTVGAVAEVGAGATRAVEGGAGARDGLVLEPVKAQVEGDEIWYSHVAVRIDRALGAAYTTVQGPAAPQPATPDDLVAAGVDAWIVAAARELDRAILDLRFNEPEVGTWVLCTEGDPVAVLAADELLRHHADHWLVREVRLLWGRVLKRLDVSARTLVALVEPGSCCAGTLAELVLAADRSFMLDGTWDGDEAAKPNPPPTLQLTEANDGWYPMANGLSRLATRFWGRDDLRDAARALRGKELLAAEAAGAGLVTFAPDDLDWDDEVRLTLEERNSFSPDALTGMEANLRFAGPETMETKVFARLSAWQNWIFQRPNAVGPAGALRRYGTGSRPDYDRERV